MIKRFKYYTLKTKVTSNILKEIIIISGKGGTGKTSITAAFACLAGHDVLVADCDVDAADMHLLMAPFEIQTQDFYSGHTAKIDQTKCIQCDRCFTACRFDAISRTNGNYTVKKIDCEGCGYCYEVCPGDAISMNNNKTGKFFISQTRMNNKLIHARLNIGADNSGKLVSKIRKEAKIEAVKNNSKFILVDGSPGIGCPVIASITGSDYIVIVTEPTLSGFHDMQRVYELIAQFSLKAGCIINKADLNPEINDKIKGFLKEKQIDLLTELNYNNVFTEAITNGQSIIEYEHGEFSEQLSQCWEKMNEIIKN